MCQLRLAVGAQFKWRDAGAYQGLARKLVSKDDVTILMTRIESQAVTGLSESRLVLRNFNGTMELVLAVRSAHKIMCDR